MNILKNKYFYIFLFAPILIVTLILMFTLNKNNSNIKESSWIKDILNGQKYDTWKVVDNKNKEVIVEGERISNIKSENKIFSTFNLDEIGQSFATTMAPDHKQLAKKYPSIFLMPSAWIVFLKMLFYKKTYTDMLKDGYIEEISDIYNLKNDYQLYLFTLSELNENKNKTLLGSTKFYIKNNYEYGCAELSNLFVKPDAQGRGLSKILISSIFKLLPQTKCIYLNVNRTNNQAIAIYESLGFVRCGENWYDFDYEYLSDKCSKLQDIAVKLKNI